jgi:hypothetical protein
LMKKIFLFGILAALVYLAGNYVYAPQTAKVDPNTSVKDTVYALSCDTLLWKHVYHRSRLRVIKMCLTASGVIEEIRKEKDGDAHVLLRLDPGQDTLLNAVNIEKQKGCLVFEPICVYTVKQENAIEACRDCPLKISIPKKGTRVAVTGSYVIDDKHGWTEIHPVSKIEVLQ